MNIDKTKLKDTMGRPLTQGLFLEIGYNTNYAIYTLSDEDKEYKGIIYPALRLLYLAEEDPTEYSFASKYLLNWRHWTTLNENKVLRPYFDNWREELEVAMRSAAVKGIIEQSTDNFQAAKWIADKGWGEKRGAGRPTKAQQDRESRILERIGDDLKSDIKRMSEFDG
jgi:hypothetical protein